MSRHFASNSSNRSSCSSTSRRRTVGRKSVAASPSHILNPLDFVQGLRPGPHRAPTLPGKPPHPSCSEGSADTWRHESVRKNASVRGEVASFGECKTSACSSRGFSEPDCIVYPCWVPQVRFLRALFLMIKNIIYIRFFLVIIMISWWLLTYSHGNQGPQDSGDNPQGFKAIWSRTRCPVVKFGPSRLNWRPVGSSPKRSMRQQSKLPAP